MKILYLITNLGNGGSQIALLAEITELIKLNYSVVVIADKGPLIEKLEELGVKVYIANTFSIGDIIVAKDKWTLKDEMFYQLKYWRKFRGIRLYNKVKRVLKAENISVIKTNHPGVTSVVANLVSKKNIKFICTVQHILSNEFPYRNYKKYKPDYYVAITEEVKTHLINNFEEIKEDKVIVIKNIINFKKNTGIEYNLPENSIILTSRLDEDKLLPIYAAIESINKLVKEKIKIHLVILGDGTCRQNLEKYCEDLDVTQNVTFLGMVNNPIDYLSNKNTIFTIGAGRSAMEALYIGKPLICASHLGYGFIFNSDNQEVNQKYNFSGRWNMVSDLSEYTALMYESLKELYLMDREKRIELSKFGRCFFEENLSTKRTVYSLTSLFESLK